MNIDEQLKWQSQDNSSLREALQICKEGRTNEYLINRSLKEEIRIQEELIDRLNLQITQLKTPIPEKEKIEPLILILDKQEVMKHQGKYCTVKAFKKTQKNMELFISKYHEQKERADKLQEQLKQLQ